MDPFAILGISANATPDEVKQAYRREAMKWHPDRRGNSDEARERFHQAAEAYKFISENNAAAGNQGYGAGAGGQRQDKHSDSTHSDNQAGARPAGDRSEDKFADSVFWDVMLDHALKLAQTGLSEREISIQVVENGCPERLAAIIAEKAFDIHSHYASYSGKQRKPGPDDSSFREERLETELVRAFVGPRHFFWSPKNTVEYYLMVFSELGRANKFNPLSWISANKRLMRILNFSIILFAVIVTALEFYPGPSKYKLLPDTVLLQLPFAVLPLMLAWSIFRKLWAFTLSLCIVYLATIACFNSLMPQALDSDLSSVLLVAAICFAPFVFIALFANYFFYRKAQAMIRSANRLFDEHANKLDWLKNRASTAATAAFMFVFIFYSMLAYLAPRSEEFAAVFSFKLPDADLVKDDVENEKARLRLEEAGQFFDIAESHFNHSPPDFLKAKMAYSTSAFNGSLLAAYRLGYMHYVGAGVSQNDVLALKYFEQATKSPLAFQPHSLQLTTEFLAESYNNLGIMYQNGYGTKKDLKKAHEMYSRGAEFGSRNARLNLESVYNSGASVGRRRLENPVYR